MKSEQVGHCLLRAAKHAAADLLAFFSEGFPEVDDRPGLLAQSGAEQYFGRRVFALCPTGKFCQCQHGVPPRIEHTPRQVNRLVSGCHNWGTPGWYVGRNGVFGFFYSGYRESSNARKGCPSFSHNKLK